jgi:hypothetical protein
MAMDFPNNPTQGQVFTVGSISYVWNGYAWAGGGSQPLPATTIVSDTPPANPRAGQTWWESDTGILFMNYNDGNGPAQWVQINASIPSVPNDGNEYAWVNNAWRMVKQTLTPTAGSTQIDVAVPGWAKMVDFSVSCFSAPGMSALCARVSGDGTTFLQGASDYQSVGPYHTSTGAGVFASSATASASYMQLSSFNDHVDVPIICKGIMNVERRATSSHFSCKNMSHVYNPTSAYVTTWFTTLSGAPAIGLRLAALRFLLTTFAAGSQIHLRWL